MNRFTTAALFLTLMGLTAPAHAGFEWIPPTATEQPRPVLAQPAQPVPVASDTLVPLPDKPAATTQMQTTTTTVTTQPTPAPQNEIVRQRVENTSPSIAWNDSQANAAPAQVTPVAMNTSSSNAPRDLTPHEGAAAPVIGASDKVEGFGRDVPLTVATRQMVPQGYVVQYGQGVDPNMTVSWTGGRSWKEALGDALAEKNLKATVIADSVMIEPVAPAQQLRAEPLATVVESAPAAPLPPVTEVTVTNTTTTSSTQSPMMQNVSYTPAAAAAPISAPQVWVAPRASTLRQVLTDWSREAGVQLQWSAQYDYPLMSDVQLTGTFEEAVETLLSGLVDAQPRPVARLHPNAPNGPAILVVETRHILE